MHERFPQAVVVVVAVVVSPVGSEWVQIAVLQQQREAQRALSACSQWRAEFFFVALQLRKKEEGSAQGMVAAEGEKKCGAMECIQGWGCGSSIGWGVRLQLSDLA